MSDAIEAAAVAIDVLWSEGQNRGPAFSETEREYQEHCRSTALAAITAYEAAKGGGVGVKPLEWGTTSYGDPEAQSVTETYRINKAWNGGWSVASKRGLLPAENGLTNFDTVEAAKAAAQADYEARIRSTLTSPASGERDTVIEECAKVAEAEELTSVPSTHFTQHEIDLVTATVRSTARSIAANIRAMLAKVKP